MAQIDDWTNDELRASVAAYLEMHLKLRAGVPVTKSRVYSLLSERFGRTPKSFEYRMQNISFVLSLMGRTWIPGLKPAKNVGANVASKIEGFIGELEGQMNLPVAAQAVEQSRVAPKVDVPPKGTKKPSSTTVSVTQYQRDLAVRAWVLEQAGGVCECCSAPAPFNGALGPFLEVHHVRRLAEGGSDTISNTIALCPNCHRHLHYGVDVREMIDGLYNRVVRLIRES